jgi:hypothetical protein
VVSLILLEFFTLALEPYSLSSKRNRSNRIIINKTNNSRSTSNHRYCSHYHHHHHELHYVTVLLIQSVHAHKAMNFKLFSFINIICCVMTSSKTDSMTNLVECSFLIDVCLKGTEIKNMLGEAEF